jgi:putative transposase
MSDYRRAYVPGGTFFFTLVSQRRAALFSKAIARRLLGSVMRRCFLRRPTRVMAIVLLPDHLHTIWTLPEGDADFSTRWAWIKKEFTKSWLALGGREEQQRESQRRERRRGVWQRRFWEHTIRDESDLEAHFDYIHYNPVKHGLAKSPRQWPWSSFHRWAAAGVYLADWAAEQDAARLPGKAGE